MRKSCLLLVVTLFLCPLISSSNSAKNLKRGINGGFGCAICTVLVSMLDQLAEVNNQTIVESVDGLCFKLPNQYHKDCQIVSEYVGPLLVELIAEEAKADDICSALGACYIEKGQQTCRLYKKNPSSKFDEKRLLHHQQKYRKRLHIQGGLKGSFCEWPVIREICALFNIVYVRRYPAQDKDGDYHSLIDGLRGASWRGKDCDDTRADIHPGRKSELLGDVDFDSNCNGIWGFDNATQKTYEDSFCKGTGQRGVVVIGDSVGAHFHAPKEWFCPPLLTKESLKPLPFVLSNEGDWPELSLGTGYMQSIWNITKGPMESLYNGLVQRNRCNHRDYQNLAVNGDDSFEIQGFVDSLSRNNVTDQPVLILLELVGNDVCNSEVDTLNHMTTAAQMHKNLISLFDKLNKKVPADSKVLIIGMADGDVLYEFLQNRTHPFGEWRNDLKYPDVYNWWNCLQVTPCQGWLNSNSTVRKLTTKRAMELSKVMNDVATQYQHHWSNLELNYMDCPITAVIQQYLFDHGPDSGWQLIEPVDGFHPNQLSQALTAAEIWRHLEMKLPHYLGPLNPNNDKIKQVFGNQGGY